MIKAYRRFALWAAVLLSVAAMSAPAVAQIPQYDGPHMWAMGWHGWFFGSIMMAIFMTALIALIVVLAWRGRRGHACSYAASACDQDAARHSQGTVRPRRNRQD
jgi:uncharacterized membrane protein